MSVIRKRDNLFFYLLLLTSFFLLLEISFFIQKNKAYLADFSTISHAITIPYAIIPPLMTFLLVQLSLHLLYCILIWAIVRLIDRLPIINPKHLFNFAIAMWLLGIVTLLVANQYYFPHSAYAALTSLFLWTRHACYLAFIILLILCFIPVTLATLSFLQLMGQYKRVALVICSASILIFLLDKKIPSYQDAATVSKPNILIIGIDSLRPDFLSFNGYKHKTPFIDSLLKEATVFSKTLTPIARTYPAWVSILTGSDPLTHGVRTNLALTQQVNKQQTLGNLLQHQGYETIYATDETRFSNIDQTFGFGQLISPPMGLSDFILGTFNDFPLSNLLINTVLGEWLFPYSYANRPVFFTYQPQSFISLLRSHLPTQRNKPLFMAVHFCLPHHPYLWANALPKEEDAVGYYEMSLAKVDEQIKSFFALLQEYKLLDNTVVVLLSDHGEALELHGDRVTNPSLFVSEKSKLPTNFYPPMLDNEGMDQSAGHGTDVLGLSQYYSLLAFKFYGQNQAVKIVPQPVSLLDIKPTLLALIGSQFTSDTGVSLLSLIKSKNLPPMTTRHIFLESDFSPKAVRTIYPQVREVLLEGIHLFEVNPKTLRLNIKPNMEEMIIQSKQYADVYGDWVLAFYPQTNETMMPILVHLPTGKWTNDLHSSFAKQSPVQLMLTQMLSHYKKEIKYVLIS